MNLQTTATDRMHGRVVVIFNKHVTDTGGQQFAVGQLEHLKKQGHLYGLNRGVLNVLIKYISFRLHVGKAANMVEWLIIFH